MHPASCFRTLRALALVGGAAAALAVACSSGSGASHAGREGGSESGSEGGSGAKDGGADVGGRDAAGSDATHGDASVSSGLARVWAIDGGEKVRQDDLDYPLANSSHNAVWNGSTISLFGAKNEIVPVQVILQAGSSGAAAVDVKLERLSNGTHAIENTTTSSDPYDYVGRQIEFYKEHYVDLTARSYDKWSSSYYASWYGRPLDIHATSIQDKSFIGMYPDALVPFSAGAAHDGAPFDIAANKNQAVWIDITIPKTAAAGQYTGTLRITEGGRLTKSIPVTLQVFKFALPDQTHLHNFWETIRSNIEDRFGVTGGSAAYDKVIENFEKFFHRNRIDMNVEASLADVKSFYSKFLNGSYYTAANGYAGPGEGAGSTMYSIGTYDQSTSHTGGGLTGFVNTESQWWQAANDWYSYFHQSLPNVEVFKYMDDEPCRSAPDCTNWSTLDQRDQSEITDIETHGQWNLDNPGVGKNLPLFDTAWPDLSFISKYITYWAAGGFGADGPPRYDLIGEVPTVHGEGEKVGTYNGDYPFQGQMAIDVPAAAVTANAWITWKYDLDFYFYWYTDNWASQGSVLDNPKPGTNTNTEPEWGNGIVVYPGSEVGLNGPLPSIRMENYRTGAQEYEYLYLAKQLGIPSSTIDAIVNSVVGQALSDATDRTSPPPFAVRGYEYEAARKQLGTLIDAKM